jgi:DNA-binding response OmpR family regulator
MPEIIAIDGDPLICELIVEALGTWGANIQCAMKGRSGRKLLASRHFDLAIIDVVLPDASGFALAALAANENTPVLFITGHPNRIARLNQYDLPYLRKPFELARLRAEAEQVMAESRQNIQRIKQGMTRLRANLAGLADTMATSRRLVDRSHQLMDKATAPESNGE